MSIPPEVAFHRFFQRLSPAQRAVYHGKFDLDKFDQPGLKLLLENIQKGMNHALKNEREVPEHRNHPPFHVDYIDSTTANAIAFRSDEHSFIGLTVPLVLMILDASARLTKSEAIISVLGLPDGVEVSNGLQVLLFRMTLFFVVTHEYTHHVHGHTFLADGDTAPISEVLSDGRVGSFEQQTEEAAADSYAMYHLMGNWIGGVEGPEAAKLLDIDAMPESAQDAILFSCIVAAVGAYLLLRPALKPDVDNVYRFTHPPQPARLDCLMGTAYGWCKQNRPSLEAAMVPDRFLTIMSRVAEVIWSEDDDKKQNWRDQAEFLRTDAGKEYIRKLHQAVHEYRSGL